LSQLLLKINEKFDAPWNLLFLYFFLLKKTRQWKLPDPLYNLPMKVNLYNQRPHGSCNKSLLFVAFSGGIKNRGYQLLNGN
jgi:hypothetical protein